METLLIKRKEFEIVEQLGDRSFKVTRKGKTFFAKKFEPRSEEYNGYIYAANRIKSSLVAAPRTVLADKKTGYIVSDYIEGKTVLEYLLENDPSDDDRIYKDIFLYSHLAKCNRMILNFKPEHWMITDKGLVYMLHEFRQYTRETDFTQTDIALWFITKSFAKYAKEKGCSFDTNRIKDEYITNKHMLMVTCKYYQ